MAEAINRSWTHWFEIPVSNFDRAKTFYETIYNMKIDSFEAGTLKMGIFPHSGAGGAICFSEHYTPGPAGVVTGKTRSKLKTFRPAFLMVPVPHQKFQRPSPWQRIF